jgi:hypothetical protein
VLPFCFCLPSICFAPWLSSMHLTSLRITNYFILYVSHRWCSVNHCLIHAPPKTKGSTDINVLRRNSHGKISLYQVRLLSATSWMCKPTVYLLEETTTKSGHSVILSHKPKAFSRTELRKYTLSSFFFFPILLHIIWVLVLMSKEKQQEQVILFIQWENKAIENKLY